MARTEGVGSNTRDAAPHEPRSMRRLAGHWQSYVATLTALSLVLVVLMALSSTVLASRQATGDVTGQLRSTASVSSDVVGQKMSDLVALVDSDATRSSLPGDIAAGSKEGGQVELILASLTRAFPGISASFIASLKGTSLATYPLEPTIIGTNFAYREWYKGLIATGKTYISDAIVTKELGNPLAVTVTAYIEGSNGQPVGILGVNYGLEAIKTFAANVGRAQRISLTITDRTGTSLTSGSTGGLLSLAKNPLVRAALQGKAGTRSYSPSLSGGRRGPTELSSYAPIRSTGWAVVASERESVAYASLNRLRATVLAIAGAIIVILLSVGFMIARSARRRRAVEVELRGLEDRINQSERLESIGRLAGGIAHDFNNLLGVILNYATFVSEELDDQEAARADIGHIQAAAERASALTKQLLAFARKEVMQTKVLSLNDVVMGVEQILRRTIGEHVTMEVSLAPDLWAVEADPGRLEQVLMNLVINARDAMPQGGTLTIATNNVEIDDTILNRESVLKPGRHVRLRIEDTGDGMDQEVLEHVFEPFFTTKAQGDGTGLGLPMVFGIIRQAGGDIRLSSQVGIGTTCDVYLPVTERATLSDHAVDEFPSNHGSETILVVEDEDALREVARRILSRSGYEVMTSSNGPEAIAMVETFEGKIDLLLSDVIMPIMVGSEVASRVRALRPGLPVLFMSGYAQPILGSTLTEGQALLAKPFSEQELLFEIRKLLDTETVVTS